MVFVHLSEDKGKVIKTIIGIDSWDNVNVRKECLKFKSRDQ